MKILRKTITTAFLFTSLLLAGCSGSGLVNEKEVNRADFVTAATATVGKNTYSDAHASGTYTVDKGTGATSYNVNQDFKYNAVTKTWIPGNSEQSTALDHVLVDLTRMEAIFSQYGIVPTFKYYVGDNGLRFTSDFSKNVDSQGNYANVSLKLDLVYNEFGYPTKVDFDARVEASIGAIQVKAVETSKYTVSYTTQNA